MRIDTLNLNKVYNLNGTNGLNNRINSTTSIKSEETENDITVNVRNYDTEKKLISGAERNFFINMFPESSKQIAKYEIFTGNGKLVNTVSRLGTIIDGKI
ncbi:MAG: hypothetical protein RBT61_10225 [Candidatus Kapabacteria bacterium]|jgi:hypothetical protein|nr:hypothetical protein [Candidatus Kapabacteria bacterium]